MSEHENHVFGVLQVPAVDTIGANQERISPGPTDGPTDAGWIRYTV